MNKTGGDVTGANGSPPKSGLASPTWKIVGVFAVAVILAAIYLILGVRKVSPDVGTGHAGNNQQAGQNGDTAPADDGQLPAQAVHAKPGAPTLATLQIAIDRSPSGLDPHLGLSFASTQITDGLIYEGLTALDVSLDVIPCLASAWSMKADGKSCTFKLRSDVVFHDGSLMTADDVVASVHRVQDPTMASPLASRLDMITSVVAADPHTVVFTLSHPSPALLGSLTAIAIVPKAMEHDKNTLQHAPDGTGPFKFEYWESNSYISLIRHESYWGTKPKLFRLKFHIVAEAATRLLGLGDGTYSLIPNSDPLTAAPLRANHGAAISEALDLSYTFIGMNVSEPPFNNPKVRQALNYAVNRDEIIQAALYGDGVPAGPLPPTLTTWALATSSFPCYHCDPAKALALLHEAGVQLPVTVTMKVFPRDDIEDIAQIVQEELGKAGFKIDLRVLEIGQFDDDWRHGRFELFASANAGAIDPDQYLYRTFHTGGSTNVFHYSDPTVDALLDRARSSLDMTERKTAYDQIQRILATSGPTLFIAYGKLFSLMGPNLHGFVTMPNRSLMMLKFSSLAD